MEQRHVANISTLIHFMEGLNDPRFTMKAYAHDCNTPACAMGWATTVPALRAEGLPDLMDLHLVLRTAECSRRVEHVFGDVFRELFGANLFMKITTPQQWAAHARDYLRKQGHEVVPVNDGFKDFMTKALKPVALEQQA